MPLDDASFLVKSGDDQGYTNDAESGLVLFGRRYFDPATGRWISPDPIGDADGPDLYAYVHNNPLTFSDLFGLATSSLGQKQQLCRHCGRPIRSKSHRGSGGSSSGLNCFMAAFSSGAFDIERFTSREVNSHTYAYMGRDHVRFALSWINGILNGEKDANSSCKYICRLSGGYGVTAVYNSTHSFFVDVWEALLGRMGVRTEPVRQLARLFVDSLSQHERLLHICHSQGAIHTYNALRMLPPELRNRIDILAVAPAKFIPDKYCGSVEHIRTKYDLVPLSDLWGLLTNRHTTQVLPSHPDAPRIMDHSFDSPTYVPYISRYIRDKLQLGGGIS